jgi:hypothetical protein
MKSARGCPMSFSTNWPKMRTFSIPKRCFESHPALARWSRIHGTRTKSEAPGQCGTIRSTTTPSPQRLRPVPLLACSSSAPLCPTLARHLARHRRKAIRHQPPEITPHPHRILPHPRGLIPTRPPLSHTLTCGRTTICQQPADRPRPNKAPPQNGKKYLMRPYSSEARQLQSPAA